MPVRNKPVHISDKNGDIGCACSSGSTIRVHGYHHPHKQTGIAAPRAKSNMGMCTASAGNGNRRRWFSAHWGKTACISCATIDNASVKGPTTNSEVSFAVEHF